MLIKSLGYEFNSLSGVRGKFYTDQRHADVKQCSLDIIRRRVFLL